MTDDRAEMKVARDAGLVKRHEQRLARAREGIEFPADGVERTAYLEGEPVTDMVIPPGAAVEQAARLLHDVEHVRLNTRCPGSDDCQLWYDAEFRAAALLPALLLPTEVTSREPEGDALKAIEKWYADMHGEDSPMFNFSSGRMSAPDDESDLKALVETATRLGRELGRREAAEEIAAALDREIELIESLPDDAEVRPQVRDVLLARRSAFRDSAHIAREIATKEPK